MQRRLYMKRQPFVGLLRKEPRKCERNAKELVFYAFLMADDKHPVVVYFYAVFMCFDEEIAKSYFLKSKRTKNARTQWEDQNVYVHLDIQHVDFVIMPYTEWLPIDVPCMVMYRSRHSPNIVNLAYDPEVVPFFPHRLHHDDPSLLPR